MPESSTVADQGHGDHDLWVRALGSTEVWVGEHLVDRWASLRGLAIFRYLVIHHPRAVHRERLMDLLWPHSSARAARNNLNVAIHGLRRSLEVGGPGPYVVFKEGCYQLAPELDVWLDVNEFELERTQAHDLMRAGDLTSARAGFERALDLYRGELFADDADGEWLLPTRRHLADHHAEALEIVANRAYSENDHITCIDTCHRLLAVDPCRESAHRLLMMAYTAQGQFHLAARQYATCVSGLQEHLNIAPHAETTTLFSTLVGSNV